MNVLCIGAHCDDVEVGLGGAILHHMERSDTVVSLVMSGSHIRAEESREAGAALGVGEVLIFDFEDTKIPAGVEAIRAIENIIERLMPDRVYTHTIKDTHQDHRNTGLASLSAARNISQVLFYQSAPPKSWTFSPNHYVDISKYMDRKLEAVKLFHSQSDKWFMNPDVLRSMARFRGLEAGVDYAEAFEIYKMLEV